MIVFIFRESRIILVSPVNSFFIKTTSAVSSATSVPPPIAMGGGTDVALETADVVLMKNELTGLTKMIRLSRKMNTIIKQNVIFSLGVMMPPASIIAASSSNSPLM